jgi:hypothetical protein
MGRKGVLDTGSGGKRSAVKMEDVRNISGVARHAFGVYVSADQLEKE